MICSEARLIANRRNALKSTGPRTVEGKAVSRANALKHGLCATVVVPEDMELVKRRTHDYFFALKPQNELQTWMVDQVAICSIRIDRCERIERRVRDKVCLRAELTWDDDRRLEAEVLGGLIAKRPAETVETLRRSPHGCEWLMTRWAMLAHAADINPGHAWTDEQTALAFDLLATPAAFRYGRPGAALNFKGEVLDQAEDSAAVARRMVAELTERREAVGPLDEVERALTEADMTNDNDPELRRLRRYEMTLHRRLRWAVEQANKKSPHKEIHPGLQPKWLGDQEPALRPVARTEAEKLAENHIPVSIHPPFDLEPDEYPEPGQKADIPAILTSRRKKQIAKAQSRREARRRKVEKLRN